ncbi:MAG: undecaprenyl/decaprenyl-phosphate alpha-N-acetylglucosaminyl 1-phosphate transferase [Verrucomicrobia bacterium]|nr:undecaprenyl/decaprenyl-phosphate alpha-N-acetylglucosaminyl 1-phosphate transferase [Verrucomicrobiota bacterium]
MLSFPFHVYLAAFVSAALCAGVGMPLWRRWCRSRGLMDDPGHRKIHQEPVPLAGGWSILCAVSLPLMVGGFLIVWPGWWAGELGPLAYGMDRRLGAIAGLLAGALGMVWLGCQDDLRELGPGPKFAGQCACALIAAVSGFVLPLSREWGWLNGVATVFWVLAVTNAMNFMDNMNGLCGGISAIATFAFGVWFAQHGQYLVASLAFLFCGAIAGFLPWNFPQGRVFLGDTGSHLLGYLLSVLPLAGQGAAEENESVRPFPTALWLLAVPLVDMVWVVVWRTWHGRRFWVGDTNHLSHQLVRVGLSKSRAVLCLWLAAAACSVLAF